MEKRAKKNFQVCDPRENSRNERYIRRGKIKRERNESTRGAQEERNRNGPRIQNSGRNNAIMCIHREESFESKLPLSSTSLQIASLRIRVYIYIYTGALYLLGRKFEEYNRIAGSFRSTVRNSTIRLH